jgi:hypothetical protein
MLPAWEVDIRVRRKALIVALVVGRVGTGSASLELRFLGHWASPGSLHPGTRPRALAFLLCGIMDPIDLFLSYPVVPKRHIQWSEIQYSQWRSYTLVGVASHHRNGL